ncbi:hypothetical protein ACP39W_002922 [Proteus mirabilis]|uniref:hypothetical protein n=1 Tax=Proteus vulgaris TaxID=585 RepID=UPI0021B14BC0|nr:hypothetical protein [Proteus vulgaris]EKV4067200.1 hypothetical protein [Proteus mirabilis]ELT1805323.1 hypothetical protein [Proteus mirabilis]MCT6518924.1 hypothetical protein [Proteus vulgaris]HEK0643305.1 hypothetical protein [Proteus mirabilis]
MKGTTLTELIKAYTDQGIGAAQKFIINDIDYFKSCDDAMMFQVIRFQRKFYPRGKALFRILSIENSAKYARSQREASNAGN